MSPIFIPDRALACGSLGRKNFKKGCPRSGQKGLQRRY